MSKLSGYGNSLGFIATINGTIASKFVEFKAKAINFAAFSAGEYSLKPIFVPANTTQTLTLAEDSN